MSYYRVGQLFDLSVFLHFHTDLLRDINDPEHPMSLEELNVVQITNINVG